MVSPELRPRSVSGGDLELAQAHHGSLADAEIDAAGGQRGAKGGRDRREGRSEPATPRSSTSAFCDPEQR